MPAPDPHHRTQEQSIKARKHQLYEADEDPSQSGPQRSFVDCLHDTPAAPLPPTIRAGLWVVGALVLLLLLAAFIKVGTRKARPRPAPLAAVVHSPHPGAPGTGQVDRQWLPI